MFKLEVENVGSGFQTLGRGELSMGPQMGLSRHSKLEISGQQFLDYEFDIRYFHTAKCGEVRMRLLVDGQIVAPDDVRNLVTENQITEPAPNEAGAILATPPANGAGLLPPGEAMAEQIAPTTPMAVSYGQRPAEVAALG